jgi:hypothetical protein
MRSNISSVEERYRQWRLTMGDDHSCEAAL